MNSPTNIEAITIRGHTCKDKIQDVIEAHSRHDLVGEGAREYNNDNKHARLQHLNIVAEDIVNSLMHKTD